MENRSCMSRFHSFFFHSDITLLFEIEFLLFSIDFKKNDGLKHLIAEISDMTFQGFGNVENRLFLFLEIHFRFVIFC